MKKIRCIANALAVTDAAILVVDGRPAVAVFVGTGPAMRLEVLSVQDGEAIRNPCDGTTWRVVDGQWDARLGGSVVVEPHEAPTASLFSVDLQLEQDLARACGGAVATTITEAG